MGVLGRCSRGLYRYLAPIEAGILFLAVFAGAYLRFGDDSALSRHHDVEVVWPDALLFTVVLLLCFTATGLYNNRLRERLEGIVIRLVVAFATGAVILAAIYYLFGDLFLGRGTLALALLIAFVAIVILRAVITKQLEEPENRRRVAVLGTGRTAALLLNLRRRTDLIGLRIVGFIPVNGESAHIPEGRKLAVSGKLLDWTRENGIDELVVAPDERRQSLDMADLMSCRAAGVLVTDVNSFIERETGCLSLNQMTPGWFAHSNGIDSPLAGDRIKRLLDIVLAGSVLVLSAPLMAAAALALRLESGPQGSLLYRQTRVGRDGAEFSLYKFRSMQEDAERPGEARWAQKNDPRVTRVGAILRRFRIDELPQLINVLRGEMSFVGPRPERPEFVSHLATTCPHYADRHRVKPGLTGWAQIRYPYGASEKDAFRKLEYDLFYVKNRHHLYLDLFILLQTAEVVLWGRGVR